MIHYSSHLYHVFSLGLRIAKLYFSESNNSQLRKAQEGLYTVCCVFLIVTRFHQMTKNKERIPLCVYQTPRPPEAQYTNDLSSPKLTFCVLTLTRRFMDEIQ